MLRLQNKTALITGSAAGIGAQTMKKFIQEGVSGIALVDRNMAAAEALAHKLDPAGDILLPLACDVADVSAVAETTAVAIDRLGAIDILVNCAGITRDAIFHKMTEEDWLEVLNVNLTGSFHLCRTLIPHMRGRNYGRIINLSSIAVRGNVGQANYSATKAALIGFSRTLAKEEASHGITVNVVAPGPTDTAMYQAVPAHIREAQLNANPMKRAAEPADVANAIAFFASDEASFISGQCLFITGGE